MKSKTNRSIIKAVVVCILLFSVTPIYADTPWLHTDGNDIKDPGGNVVVLRGVDLIDLGAYERFYGGTIAMIDRLTDLTDPCGTYVGWYPKVLRLAVYPSDETDFDSPLTFAADNDYYYDNVLRPVIDYCAEKDLYAIIEFHYVQNTFEGRIQTSEFWEYVAPRFAGDSHVIFELFNEPINGSSWPSVKIDMQAWVDIVRFYAPKNIIIVAGPQWTQIIGPIASDPLTGDNIVVASHIYPGHWLSGNPWYTDQINTCLTAYPVFMSEWGFSEAVNQQHLKGGTIDNYGQPLMDFDEGRKISNSCWVAHDNWQPPMYYTGWGLRIGPKEMGGFVKDTLYLRRNDDLPSGGVDNLVPTVTITSPLNDDVCSPGSDVVIEASASDIDGTVTKVEFYVDYTKIGEDIDAPYSYTWEDVPIGRHKLAAKATDDDGEARMSPMVSIIVPVGQATGRILREWWIELPVGTSVSVLTSDVNYPNNPSGRELVTKLMGPIDWQENDDWWVDHYGARFRGYLHPPADGDYTFWISSNCKSELRLSTDADPAHSVLIASEPCAPYPIPYEWEKYAWQRSSPISLTAGSKYYIDVLHMTNIGDDHIEVAWEGPGISQQVIDGAYLSPWLYNFKEYSIFAGQWGKTNCARSNAWCQGADRDRDGDVQLDDLMAFAEWWLVDDD